jgi:biopolymer transport protein ExbD
MKIRGARQVHYDSGPNMIPLVDIVMVILIFLMLVGQFGGLEHYLTSSMPYTQSGMGGERPPTSAIPDEPLEIRVHSTAPDLWQAQIGGRFRSDDLQQLTAQMRQLREELNAAGTTDDRIHVVISPDRGVKYDYLIGIYQAAMDAGLHRISFARSQQ